MNKGYSLDPKVIGRKVKDVIKSNISRSKHKTNTDISKDAKSSR